MPDELVDYYGLLQVDSRAELDVIQAAYRVLARKAHPDRSGDEGRMKLLNEAWHTLRDPARRSRYDRARGFRSSALAGRGGTDRPGAAQPAAGQMAQPNAPTTVDPDSAGPPPGKPWGSVLTFGRFNGWSLGEIARVDPEYLEWLQRAPAGIRFRAEIDLLLRSS
jgi:curved DNA-binding protein CbpA